MTQEEFEQLCMDYAAEHLSEALAVFTGLFVGLAIHAVQASGNDPSKTITIDGGDLRDITIHAAKTEVHDDQ